MKLINHYFYLFFLQTSNILVGGQAVIEGVMMRVPGAYATAVRNPKGKIQIDRHMFTPIIKKYPRYNIPILRGIIGLYESLKIGFSTLQWSAEINEPQTKPSNLIIETLITLFSIIFALGLFIATPIGLTTWLIEKDQNALLFNIISGLIRIMIFLIYLISISFMSDVFRLFQYHGAEHKTVYNFESGNELSIYNAQQYPTQHPRCGTSFLFIIMLVSIISFTIIDFILIYFLGPLTAIMRITIHIPFIPLVTGFGYELLKLTANNRNNLFFHALAKPGLLLQNITTKQPDDEQVDVALTALKSAFGNKLKDHSGNKYTAEAIG